MASTSSSGKSPGLTWPLRGPPRIPLPPPGCTRSGGGGGPHARGVVGKCGRSLGGRAAEAGVADFPDLPEIPDDVPVGDDDDDDVKKGGGGGEDEEEINFDDLTKRFEALKKKK